eukprot:1208856-Amphidinium_carterae.1
MDWKSRAWSPDAYGLVEDVGSQINWKTRPRASYMLEFQEFCHGVILFVHAPVTIELHLVLTWLEIRGLRLCSLLLSGLIDSFAVGLVALLSEVPQACVSTKLVMSVLLALHASDPIFAPGKDKLMCNVLQKHSFACHEPTYSAAWASMILRQLLGKWRMFKKDEAGCWSAVPTG